MEQRSFLNQRETDCDAVLLTSRENKFYSAQLYSASGFVFICKEETYIIVDGRYYTDMQQKNQKDTILLMEDSKPYWEIINHLAQKHTVRTVGIESSMDLATYRTLEKRLTPKLLDMDFEAVRAIKSAREIETIASACKIAVKAFEYSKTFIKVGMREEEIANELVYYMKKNGAQRESFDTIVLSGERGALPHGKPGRRKVENGDFVVMDFGAVYENYCSDITRTLQVGSKENPKLKEIYDCVLTAQVAAIEAVKPGKKCCEIDAIARAKITESGYGAQFSHNLGHSIGIMCHEQPCFSPNDTTVLQPGMVLTIEPGIYVAGLGGVRIEDDIVVTAHGCEVLTGAAGKEFQII